MGIAACETLDSHCALRTGESGTAVHPVADLGRSAHYSQDLPLVHRGARRYVRIVDRINAGESTAVGLGAR